MLTAVRGFNHVKTVRLCSIPSKVWSTVRLPSELHGIRLAVACSTRHVPVPIVEPTIDRSAAESAKGPRLQRLRAALFLIEALTRRDIIHAYVAVETEGDVFVSTHTPSETLVYSEEDKNYDKDASFSFVSHSVLNSIIIFLDQWCSWHNSPAIRFGLYTTVNIAKEINSGRVRDLGLTLPDRAIIELLRARDYSDPRLLTCTKALILDEYEAQYRRISKSGHLARLKQFTQVDWTDFLGLVDWLFAEADEAHCLQKLIEAIKKCPFFNEKHEGKEDLIYSAILELLDERQLVVDYAGRFVHRSDVALIFKKIESGEIRREDPTWRTWDKIPTPTDQRNVGEKLTSTCPDISGATLSRYQRRTAAGLSELETHSQDKNVRAMRFQIYDVCEDALSALARAAPKLTEQQLNIEIDHLTLLAIERVAERSSEYSYSHRSDAFIRGIVLELFDSCFLAFDTVTQ